MIEQIGESEQQFMDLFTEMTKNDIELDVLGNFSDSYESEEVKQE